MSVFVVDASLVIKWFVPEIHSEAARRWLSASHDYVAPDLLFSEAGNAVWKKVRRKELEETEARQLVIDLAQVAVETVATRSLVEYALALALTAGVTVYDAMYLALAVRLETEVITGDDRFADKLAEPLGNVSYHVRTLADLGLIELVRKVPRRGAIEHYYRAPERHVLRRAALRVDDTEVAVADAEVESPAVCAAHVRGP